MGDGVIADGVAAEEAESVLRAGTKDWVHSARWIQRY